MVITGDAIPVARLITLKHMLKLEIKGLTRHGQSAYSLIKKEFNLKGNKRRVLAQFEQIVIKEASKLEGSYLLSLAAKGS